MSQMKYTYVPTSRYRDKSFGAVYKSFYWIDSDERVLRFRNQYSEQFLFMPLRAVKVGIATIAVVAFILGKLL